MTDLGVELWAEVGGLDHSSSDVDHHFGILHVEKWLLTYDVIKCINDVTSSNSVIGFLLQLVTVPSRLRYKCQGYLFRVNSSKIEIDIIPFTMWLLSCYLHAFTNEGSSNVASFVLFPSPHPKMSMSLQSISMFFYGHFGFMTMRRGSAIFSFSDIMLI